SIVILYYNKPALTGRCLASVQAALASTPGARVLLVDNGSTRAFEASAVERVRLECNQGFARGMNAGLRAAFANSDIERVLALSNDVELPVDFFSEAEALPPEGGPVIFCPHAYFLSDRSKRAYTHGSFDETTHELAHHFNADLLEFRFPLYYPAAATLWTRAA